MAIIDLWDCQNAINDLLNDDYDEDFLRPTDNAINETLRLLQGVTFKGWLSTLGDGGIRAEWRNGNREIRLLVGTPSAVATPVLHSYIYYDQDNHYGIDNVTTPERLNEWLKWLLA